MVVRAVVMVVRIPRAVQMTPAADQISGQHGRARLATAAARQRLPYADHLPREWSTHRNGGHTGAFPRRFPQYSAPAREVPGGKARRSAVASSRNGFVATEDPGLTALAEGDRKCADSNGEQSRSTARGGARAGAQETTGG
jgi:hypothetical protein